MNCRHNDGASKEKGLCPGGGGRINVEFWYFLEKEVENPSPGNSFRIEKSRQIFPAMIRAAEECPKGSQLNWKYFFNLLFTRENLKLVHIGCHVKGEHQGFQCQSRYFYVNSKR